MTHPDLVVRLFLLPPANEVMFLHVSVILSTGGVWSRGMPALGDACSRGGRYLLQGVHAPGRGCLLWGCLLLLGGGACSGRGVGVWSWDGCQLRGVPGGDPPKKLLLRAVRILLECILVVSCCSCWRESHLLMEAI